MNKFTFMGRLTADPDVKYVNSDNMAIAEFTLAVDRRYKREGEPEADFFRMKAFGKIAEHIYRYYKKGMKMAAIGHVQNSTYEKDGKKVYSTYYIVDETYFCESKKASDQQKNVDESGFMNIPDGIDETLPFN